MAKGEVQLITVVILGFLLLTIFYIIMVYPSERSEMLLGESGDVRINIIQGKLYPDEVSSFPGWRVLWVNKDGVGYTLSFGDEKGFVPPSGTFAKRFPDEGTFQYSSEENPGLRGKIIVTENVI